MDELKKYIQNNQEALDCEEPAPMVWENIQAQLKPAPKTIRVIPIARLVQWAVAACVIGIIGMGGWYFLLEPSVKKVSNQVTSKVANKTGAHKEDQIVKSKPAEEKKSIVEPTIIENNSEAPLLAKQENQFLNKQKGTKPTNHSAAYASTEPTEISLATFKNVETSFTQVINLQKARISTYPMYAESADYFKDFNIQIKQMEKEERDIKSSISKAGINNDLLDQLINLYQQKLTILKQLQLEMNKTNNRFKQNRGPVDTTRSYFLSI